MKKKIVLILGCALLAIEMKPMYSSGALAGSVVGGLVGGYILGRLIPKREKGAAYYSHKEREDAKKAAKRQKHKHEKEIKKHQKELNRLKKDGQEHSQAAQYHRERIQYHEGIIAQIDEELRYIVDVIKDDIEGHKDTKKAK